jgi:DNA-directed RNA polymerase specialized sigma24 family protein
MYCVKIKDVTGHEVTVEVTFDIFQLFEDERKELERERFERREHWDKRGLEDYILENEATEIPETLEDLFFRQETFRSVKKALQTCSPRQQERFYLHCVSGYSYGEIARLQGCTKHSVWTSVETVKKIIKNSL